jgi:hypothetical protein
MLAEVTRFYAWGPNDAWDLPWSRLLWWNAQAHRMAKG